MIFIDANVFFAFDNNEDVHHSRALSLWQEIDSGKFGPGITSDYVFNEVVGITFRKRGKEAAIKLGRNIMKAIPIFYIDEHVCAEAWKMFAETELNLNLVDCSSIVAAKAVNANAIATFDKEFKKVPGVKVVDG